MSDAGLLLEPLLAELDLDVAGRRVTAIGGGHGLAVALRGILDYADTITAIVGVSDDGGSSGRLAPALAIPPMGDIRRALVALSPDHSLWRSLMEYRFGDGDADVGGHSLGNLLIAALTEMTGGFEEALATAGRLLGARGAVVPAAVEPLTLEAEVEGRTVQGQVAIATGRGRISALRVLPESATATRSALAAIAAADEIVLGPGSLFTSVIAGLRVPGISDAVNSAEGRLVYVCNLTTQDGETLGLDGDAHIGALTAVGGIRTPDVVVAHDGPLLVPPGLEQVPVPRGGGVEVVTGDLADPNAEWPAHDSARLGAVLRRLA
jgi:uncharacterized cofD-like protein